jgi:serine phosphatase RsbU (regulator of sigma subunit)
MNHITFDYIGISYSNTSNVVYQYKLEGADENWSVPLHNSSATYSNLSPGKYCFTIKSSIGGKFWTDPPIKFWFEISPPYYKTIWFIVLMTFVALVLALTLHQLRLKRVSKSKVLLEQQVMTRTVEIVRQKEIIEQKNKDITDSIHYAQKIQKAVMPVPTKLKELVSNSFIFFRPRDIVSGDFYFFRKMNDRIIVAAVDCTGHGVPGALMSMIGSTLIKDVVVHEGITNPEQILDHLDKEIKFLLKQDSDGPSAQDGMDLGLMEIDTTNNVIHYAGANRPLFMIREDELIEHKGDNFAIGGLDYISKSFTSVAIEYKKGDRFYLTTDGFVDQFGGESGKKYMKSRLKKVLLKTTNLNMASQGEYINNEFDEWKSNEEQVDDVLVIGLQF